MVTIKSLASGLAAGAIVGLFLGLRLSGHIPTLRLLPDFFVALGLLGLGYWAAVRMHAWRESVWLPLTTFVLVALLIASAFAGVEVVGQVSGVPIALLVWEVADLVLGGAWLLFLAVAGFILATWRSQSPRGSASGDA